MAVKASRAQIIAIPSGLALALAVAAIAGFVVAGRLTGPLFTIVLAFGAAALLYLVTEELFVEAHEVPETSLTIAMFFVGFLALFVIEMIA